MRSIYDAALKRIDSHCASFLDSLMDPSLPEAVRGSLRERRDYWHALGSRIRRRQTREANRTHDQLRSGV